MFIQFKKIVRCLLIGFLIFWFLENLINGWIRWRGVSCGSIFFRDNDPIAYWGSMAFLGGFIIFCFYDIWRNRGQDSFKKINVLRDLDKDLNKGLIQYFFLNTVCVNLFWWFIFTVGTGLTSHKPCFFNNVIDPVIDFLYGVFIVASLFLPLIGVLILKVEVKLGRMILLIGILCSMFSPCFVGVYYVSLFMNKMANSSHLMIIFISFSIAYFNFLRGKFLLKKLTQC